MTIAICILCVCISVYLAYTCEMIKNKRTRIFLGILTGVLFVSSFIVLFLSVLNGLNEQPVSKVYISIVYILIALVLISLRFKIKQLHECRKTQNRIKINEDI